MRIGLLLQVIAALCTMLGLARWSTAQWSLATSWPLADAAQRVCLAVMFDVLNVFLGNGIGEFVGELTLYGSFRSFAISLNYRSEKNGCRVGRRHRRDRLHRHVPQHHTQCATCR